jgi:hypothetical protein
MRVKHNDKQLRTSSPKLHVSSRLMAIADALLGMVNIDLLLLLIHRVLQPVLVMMIHTGKLF